MAKNKGITMKRLRILTGIKLRKFGNFTHSEFILKLSDKIIGPITPVIRDLRGIK